MYFRIYIIYIKFSSQYIKYINILMNIITLNKEIRWCFKKQKKKNNHHQKNVKEAENCCVSVCCIRSTSVPYYICVCCIRSIAECPLNKKRVFSSAQAQKASTFLVFENQGYLANLDPSRIYRAHSPYILTKCDFLFILVYNIFFLPYLS